MFLGTRVFRLSRFRPPPPKKTEHAVVAPVLPAAVVRFLSGHFVSLGGERAASTPPADRCPRGDRVTSEGCGGPDSHTMANAPVILNVYDMVRTHLNLLNFYIQMFSSSVCV